MKCAVHAELDATGFCRNCGKPLCPQCTREVRGALYCEECLSKVLAGPAATGPVAKPNVNPGLACALGFIPGLGAVYNGEYIKALIHVVIFGGLIALMSSDYSGGTEAFFIVVFVAFCCYMPIDAYRVARARRLGEAVPAAFPGAEDRRPIGAIVLIAVGILFLLANFGLLEREWFARGWPAGLIVLGVWMLWSRLRRDS